jgi:uncharacterized protein YgbK (DUF1537 family)
LVGSALALVGSLNPVSAGQLLRAKARMSLIGLDLDLDLPDARHTPHPGIVNILKESERLLESGRPLAVSSAFSPRRPEMKTIVPSVMAEIAERLVRDHGVSGLFLSGGDVAWEVCRRLRLSPISVLGEIEPGVPAGVAEGSEGRRIRLVTKAGGFGSQEVILKSLPFLECGELP